MTAKVISVANMKGGVGKTTVAVALTHEFAKGVDGAPGARVLLVDLDAQANASFWLCGDADLTELIERGKTVDAFLEDTIIFGKAPSLKDYVHELSFGSDGKVFVIPSSPGMRIVEREMISFLSRRTRSLLEVERVVSQLLVDQLEALKADYDVIIFDSAPGISALTEAALRASDVVVVPTVPDFISNLGLDAFCKSVWWSSQGAPEQPQKTPWVLANMVRGTSHHQGMLQAMREEAGAEDPAFRMFALEIPDMPWIEEATARVNGAGAHAFAADASGLFAKLAAEVVEAMKASPSPAAPQQQQPAETRVEAADGPTH
jgi:cellulose biosynthesis protein BcsQ